MILVTVGTTQFPFYSMRSIVEDIVENNHGVEKIIFQHGNTLPVNTVSTIKNISYVSFQQMQQYITRARVVICHGGPATVYQALWQGKIPIVVPRQKKYGEHVSNHQVDFCEYLYKNNLALSYEASQAYIHSSVGPLTGKNINHNKSIKKIISFLDDQMSE